jgi:hypothetical protein
MSNGMAVPMAHPPRKRDSASPGARHSIALKTDRVVGVMGMAVGTGERASTMGPQKRVAMPGHTSGFFAILVRGEVHLLNPASAYARGDIPSGLPAKARAPHVTRHETSSVQSFTPVR